MFILFLLAAGLRKAEGKCDNGTIIASGLNCDQKQFIVDLHNQLRDEVAAGNVTTQPTAANMIEMRWSEPLARKAQEWGNGCVFAHDTDRTLDGQPFGQNLALLSSMSDMFKIPDLKALVSLWIEEVYTYGYNGTYDYNSGHYSQVASMEMKQLDITNRSYYFNKIDWLTYMIWGNTSYVGCGLTYYKKQNFYFSYLVCNYSPPGNWIGELPYVYGDQDCEVYDFFNATSYDNLCAIDNEEVQPCRDGEKEEEKS